MDFSILSTHRFARNGIVLMLAASFSFALMAAAAKQLSTYYDAVQQVFFRNLVGVIFILVSLWKRPAVHEGGRLGLLIFRGAVGTISLYLLFYAIGSLGLGRAITYQYTYPILLVLISALIFKERLKIRELAAILVGFIGICFVFQPDLDTPIRNHVIGLSNALLTTFAYIAIKQLSRFYDSRYIVLSFMLSGIILPLISMTLGAQFYWSEFDFLLGHFRWPATLSHWLLFIGLGVAALIGQIFMTKAFTYGEAGEVAAVSYSNILFSTLLGILLGESLPNAAMLLGMLLIIGGGILVSIKKDQVNPIKK